MPCGEAVCIGTSPISKEQCRCRGDGGDWVGRAPGTSRLFGCGMVVARRPWWLVECGEKGDLNCRRRRKSAKTPAAGKVTCNERDYHGIYLHVTHRHMTLSLELLSLETACSSCCPSTPPLPRILHHSFSRRAPAARNPIMRLHSD